VVVRWPHGVMVPFWSQGTSQMMQELDEVHVLPFDDLSINCICELVTFVVSL